ncbi:hypothetical protein Tco_1011111 [Tanacetum coccineum]
MLTAEAEYVSLSACCTQVIWMRMQLLDYGFRYNKITMYYDSKSEIAISCNLVQHSHTKHINIRYHFVKKHVEKGAIELYYVGTEYQLVDLFVKALPRERFEYLVHRIGIKFVTLTELESSKVSLESVFFALDDRTCGSNCIKESYNSSYETTSPVDCDEPW